MGTVQFACAYDDKVLAHANQSAANMRRGAANIEDQLSAAFSLLSGLQILAHPDAIAWENAIDRVLSAFIQDILAAEKIVEDGFDNQPTSGSPTARETLVSFLMSFASRASSRERLHIFTTNYDRLIERGADIAGLRIVDRFVGALESEFRSSRLQIDLHYMPPGVRGEPRRLEGVIHMTKLHGSLDWRYQRSRLWRSPLPFGADNDHPGVPESPRESVMIYPNAAKDLETAAYPYADLFRDFSAALCRPNNVLITYGYGFGDDHINRIIADMLTIPSTHLVIIAWGDKPHDRISSFIGLAGHLSQTTLLLGKHFGDIGELVGHYLPKPAIDPLTLRMVELLDRRGDNRKGKKQNRRNAFMATAVERLGALSVGQIELVTAEELSISLFSETPQATALNTGVPTGFPRINAYVIVPNETGAVVAIVKEISIANQVIKRERGWKEGLVDLPFPARMLRAIPFGSLTREDEASGMPSYRLERVYRSCPRSAISFCFQRRYNFAALLRPKQRTGSSSLVQRHSQVTRKSGFIPTGFLAAILQCSEIPVAVNRVLWLGSFDGRWRWQRKAQLVTSWPMLASSFSIPMVSMRKLSTTDRFRRAAMRLKEQVGRALLRCRAGFGMGKNGRPSRLRKAGCSDRFY